VDAAWTHQCNCAPPAHNTSVTRVYLGLGSNLGDREAALAEGTEAIEAHGVRIAAKSSIYLTEPVGDRPRTGS
jgi:7,8-dihydro-6-hydroxymethylpterin-pyrophosphokinase